MDIIIKNLTGEKASRIINLLASLCKNFESYPIDKDGWANSLRRTHAFEVYMHQLDKSKTKLIKSDFVN